MLDSQVPAGFAPLNLPPSGFLETIGPLYGCRRGDGHPGDTLIIGLRIAPRHCNSAGIAHGGLLLSLVDVVLTVGTNFNAGTARFLPTVSLSCDFLRSAAVGTWIAGTAQVLRMTRSLIFSQMLLEDDRGVPLVRASGTLLLRGEPSPAYHRDRYLPPQGGEA